MSKAQDAKRDTDIAEAKEAAVLSATGHIADYMDKKYVKNDSSVANMSKGKYVADQMDGETSGAFTFTTSGTDLTVTKSGTTIVTGTIDTDGNITWNETPGEGGGQVISGTVQSLAQSGKIKLWDRIDYNPGTGTTASINLPAGAKIEGTKLASIESDLPAGASLNGTINADSATDWVVIDVNQSTGEVLIMPTTVSSTTLTLSEKDGYNNAIEALDAVAGIYLNPAYATSARSLTVEDVNKAEGHTADGNVTGQYIWNHRYGVDVNLNITDSGSDSDSDKQPSRTYESTATTGYYSYLTRNFTSLGSCWLASRCLDVYSDSCNFGVRSLGDGYVNYSYLFVVVSNGYTGTNDGSFPVVPVVSLKSNIQLTQGTEGTEKVEVGTSGNDEHTTFDRVYNAWTINE